MQLWEETSFQLEKFQMNPVLAEQEFDSFQARKQTDYVINFKWNKAYVSGKANLFSFIF